MPKAKKQEGSNEEPPLPPSSEIEPLLQEMKKVLSLLREKIEERAQQLREAQTKLKESERLTSGQIAAFVADQFRNSLCVIKHASQDLKAKMSNHPQSGNPEETTSVTDGRCKKSRTGLTAGKRK